MKFKVIPTEHLMSAYWLDTFKLANLPHLANTTQTIADLFRVGEPDAAEASRLLPDYRLQGFYIDDSPVSLPNGSENHRVHQTLTAEAEAKQNRTEYLFFETQLNKLLSTYLKKIVLTCSHQSGLYHFTGWIIYEIFRKLTIQYFIPLNLAREKHLSCISANEIAVKGICRFDNRFSLDVGAPQEVNLLIQVVYRVKTTLESSLPQFTDCKISIKGDNRRSMQDLADVVSHLDLSYKAIASESLISASSYLDAINAEITKVLNPMPLLKTGFRTPESTRRPFAPLQASPPKSTKHGQTVFSSEVRERSKAIYSFEQYAQWTELARQKKSSC